MADSSVPITAGTGTDIDTFTVGTQHRQVVMLGDHGGYRGRASSFRTAGIAGTTGQILATLHNATGSTIRVDLHKVTIDRHMTAVVAATVAPIVIRLYKITVLPTGGTNMTKVAEDSSRPATSASVTIKQGTASDGGAATAITTTIPAGAVITSEFAPRMITAAGFDIADRVEFLDGTDECISLNALEGVAIVLDYTDALANVVANNQWITSFQWEEYTP